jgi:hypothetical protein
LPVKRGTDQALHLFLSQAAQQPGQAHQNNKIKKPALLDAVQSWNYIKASMREPALIKADRYLDSYSGHLHLTEIHLFISFLNFNSIINNVPF